VRPDKLIVAEDFIKKEGFLHFIDLLNKSENKKVAIMGCSHSAFSAAWILINGPAMA
jgi:hypothetical protein